MTNSDFVDQEYRLSVNGFFICLMSLILVAFSITLRVLPSIIDTGVFDKVSLSVNDFNATMSHYQYWLIIALILAGFFLDFFNSAKVLLVAALVAAIGNEMFAFATMPDQIYCGRLMLSFAHPFILIGSMKIAAEYLPRKYFPVMIALIFMNLLLAPQAANWFLSSLSDQAGIQAIFFLISGIGLAAAMVLIFLSRRVKNNIHFTANQDLGKSFNNPKLWLICCISCIGWLSNTILLNWGSYLLNHLMDFSMDDALSTITYCFSFFAIMGVVASLLACFKFTSTYLIQKGFLIAAISFVLFLISAKWFSGASPYFLYITAAFSAVAILSYPLGLEHAGSPYIGVVLGLIAMFTTAGNTLLAWMGKFATDYFVTKDVSLGPWLFFLLLLPLLLLLGIYLTKKLEKTA